MSFPNGKLLLLKEISPRLRWLTIGLTIGATNIKCGPCTRLKTAGNPPNHLLKLVLKSLKAMRQKYRKTQI
jgi:hypothetical protein